MLNSATGIPLDATCRQIIQLLTFSAAQAALYIPSNWLTNGFLFKVIDAATTTCNRTHLIKYPPTVSDFLTYWSYMWSDHYQITDNLQLACAQASTSIATISLFRMALWGEIVQTGRLDWNSQDRPGPGQTKQKEQRKDRQERHDWHLNYAFQCTCVAGQLSQFLSRYLFTFRQSCYSYCDFLVWLQKIIFPNTWGANMAAG